MKTLPKVMTTNSGQKHKKKNTRVSFLYSALKTKIWLAELLEGKQKTKSINHS